MHYNVVLLIFIVEAEINQLRVVAAHNHHSGVASAGGLGAPLLARLLLSLNYVEEVHGFKLEYLGLLVVPEQRLENLEGLLRCHRELLPNRY
jgi:hypothetical protein